MQSSRMRELQSLVFDMLLLPRCSYWNISSRNTSIFVDVFTNDGNLLLKYFLKELSRFLCLTSQLSLILPVSSSEYRSVSPPLAAEHRSHK